MKDKKTVFVLGAGASCPYGYPSGDSLRERIRSEWFVHYLNLHQFAEEKRPSTQKMTESKDIMKFREAFCRTPIPIDQFMAISPIFAPIGKYIIAFEIFRAEQLSCFEKSELSINPHMLGRESQQSYFTGEDWYSHLFKGVLKGLTDKSKLPDFSNGNLAFITFNYDRSLEQFLYEKLHYSYFEASEEMIVKTLNQLDILHIYGQIAPLKWQNSTTYVDYKSQVNESILQDAAKYIETIHEKKQNPKIEKAKELLKQANEIFFLGFGYAKENMDVLGLPQIIPPGNCMVYGTAFGLCKAEIGRIKDRIIQGLTPDSLGFKNSPRVVIEPTDCLDLLRNYFEY